MRKKSIFRGVLIVAGLLAAAIIVLSHSISFDEVVTKKATSEKADEKSDQKSTTLQVPAEAVTQGTAVQIDEQVPETVIETISNTNETKKFIPATEKLISNFFRVLFQVVIAPNAP